MLSDNHSAKYTLPLSLLSVLCLVCYLTILVQYIHYPYYYWVSHFGRLSINFSATYVLPFLLLSVSLWYAIWQFHCNIYTTPITTKCLILVCYPTILVLPHIHYTSYHWVSHFGILSNNSSATYTPPLLLLSVSFLYAIWQF